MEYLVINIIKLQKTEMKTVNHILKLSVKIKHIPVFRPIVLLAIYLSIVISSCSYDNETAYLKKSKNIKVNILNVPTAFNQQTASESYISEIKALVYIYDGSNYTFNYLADVENVYHGSGGYTNFTLTLFGESKPVKVTIIANGNNAVNTANLLFGETETSINQKINKQFTTNGISENLPMWAEFLFANGVSSSLENTFYGGIALRAVARADIDASNVSSSFEMTSVQIYRANSSMQLIPNYFTTNPLKVDAPSIPELSTPTINTQPIAVSQNISTSQLYLPESVAPNVNQQITGGTCIIVGGRYNGSPNTTYYRLDFDPPVPGYPLGQILRNHQYTFNIISVNAPGWPTPDDAANNISSNIVAEVLDWTDIYTNVNIGGTNFFFIPSRSVNLSGEINEVASLDISTDIENCVLYWSDALGNPTDDYTGISIANNYFAATISPSDIKIQALAYNRFGNGVREQYFTVAAGRLRTPILIQQHESSCAAITQINTVGTTTRTVNINGASTTLEVQPVFDGGGSGSAKYQWYRNTVNNNTSGTIISGASSSTYTPPTNSVGTVFYYCVLTNDCDGIAMASPVFTFITQCPSPSPLNLGGTQNPSGTVNSGTNVTMSVTPPTLPAGSTLGYRWFQNNVLIAGATTSSLTRNVTANTTFRCEAFNATCTSTVSSRTFTVNVIALSFNTIEFQLASQNPNTDPWTIFGNTPGTPGQATATSLRVRRGTPYRFRSVVRFSSGQPAQWSSEMWSTHTGGGSSTRFGPTTINGQSTGTIDMTTTMTSFQVNSAVFNAGTGAFIQDGTRWTIFVDP